MKAKHYYLSVLLLLVATLGLRAQSKTVTLTEAGTLSNFISEAEQTTITDLTIKGPINSADILTIRAMANNLQVLNLLDANIVYSADSYYGGGSSINHTQNDVVGNYMFFGMVKLVKIVLPKDVWSIGSWSENDPWNDDHTMLRGYPSSTWDGSLVFARCVNLQEVVLPDGLLSIGMNAFDYCIKLPTITLPEGLENIGQYAFNECQSLTSINIPASLGSPTVMYQYIQNDGYFKDTSGNIFQNCVSLSQVTLSEGLKGLPYQMFNGCIALKNITLPESIVYLNSSFTNCSALETLEIPSSVITVGGFNGCSSLKEIIIPEGVTELRQSAFQNCTSLTKISLPSTLSDIPSLSFQNCTSLISIILPDNILTIGNEAFSGCTALQSIVFPKELNTIGSDAFYGCTSLTKVELPSKLLITGNRVFAECVSLATVMLPQSLAEIGYETFRGCISLTSVNLPSILMHLNNSTFLDCEKLATIELPAGLQSIGESVFSGCKSLKKIIIPGGVQYISSGAFSGCGLTEVVFNEGLITLAANSFSGCRSLGEVIFPASIQIVNGLNGSGVKKVSFAEGAAPEKVEAFAFDACDSLQSIVLPNSIKTIGEGAFQRCSTLTSITLPTSITQISEFLFTDCYALRSVTIPEGVTELGRNAFAGCYKLNSISLPSTLTKIGGSAFYESGIESITIPEGVSTLYGSTFYNCDSLTTVILPASLTRMTKRHNDENEETGYAPFEECNRLSYIDASKAKLTELPERAFSYLKIRSLDLSASTLSTLPAYFCGSCDSLRSIKIPNNIEYIGKGAFAGCESLVITSLPTSLKVIEESAFEGVHFQSLVFPSGVTKILNRTFAYATIDDVTIPETIISIDDYAFSDAEVKGTLTINPATNLFLGNSSFNCSGSKYDTSGNRYYYHLSTVNWNSTTIFPKDKFCEIDNLYLPEGGKVSSEDYIGYIFYNGITDSVAVAATYNNGLNYYRVKQPMKTRKVTYTKRFSVTSGFGEAAGWKTLVLPFTVTKITHTRGYGESQETVTLAPFGSTALETEGVLPFWLYELGTDGNYKAATAIEANKAYLICMPNNNAYPSENNISGDVLFMAEDATNGITLGVTEGALSPSTGTKFDLVPTYEQVAHGLNVYTLNEDNYYYADDKTYPNGSVFVQDYEDVYPFEAYLVSKEAQAGTLNATRYYAIGGGDGTITGIEDGPAMPDQATRAYSRGGVLYIQTNADRTIYIYNVQGQTVRIVNAHEGLNEVRGLEEGIYMLEGQKVVVK